MTNLSVIFFNSPAILAHSVGGFHASLRWTKRLGCQVLYWLHHPQTNNQKPVIGQDAVHRLHLFDDLCSVYQKK